MARAVKKDSMYSWSRSVVNKRDFVFKEKKMKAVMRFLKDEQGTETVEWAIIIGIIAVGAIGFIASIGDWVQAQFAELNAAIPAP